MSEKNLVLSFDSCSYVSTCWKEVPDRIYVTITREFIERAKCTVEQLKSEGQNSATDAGLEFEAYDEDDEGEYMVHVSRYQLYDVGTIIYGNGDLRLSFDEFSIKIGTIVELDDKMNTEYVDNHFPAI